MLLYIFGEIICLIGILYLKIRIYFRYLWSWKNHYKIYDKLLLNCKNSEFINNKIVSYNIHYGCDYYDNIKLNEILLFLKNEKAEIYVLQEFINIKFNNGKDSIYYIKKYLNMENHHIEYLFRNKNYEFSNIILCKNKIKDYKKLKYRHWYLKNKNSCFSIKTQLYNQDIWISNVHFISDITGKQQIKQSKNLIEYIKNIDESHLIVGDFNTPYNYKSVQYLKNNLKLCENRYNTFPSIYPFVKLDYCFTYKMEKRNVYRKNIFYSDHLPLIIE